MGAWGAGPFDNDTASDWVWSLEDLDPQALRDLLRATARAEYLEAPEGAEALAAAEVVAAAAGAPTDPLPDEVRAWIAANPAPASEDDRRLAANAVRRVCRSDSELAELWAEVEEDDWTDHCEDLLARLGAG